LPFVTCGRVVPLDAPLRRDIVAEMRRTPILMGDVE
jgi:hypothetical protein